DRSSAGRNGSVGQDSAAMRSQRKAIVGVMDFLGSMVNFEHALMDVSGKTMEEVRDLSFTALRSLAVAVKGHSRYSDHAAKAKWKANPLSLPIRIPNGLWPPDLPNDSKLPVVVHIKGLTK
ncbi:hypothetical protein HDU67_004305, partial [Dinochytrium kinnereticum]